MTDNTIKESIRNRLRRTPRRAEEQDTLVDILRDLSDGHPDLLDRAMQSTKNARGMSSLRDVANWIMKEVDPALAATVSAAEDFARAVSLPVNDARDVPHFNTVLDRADDDLHAPQSIFNDAARHLTRFFTLPDGHNIRPNASNDAFRAFADDAVFAAIQRNRMARFVH